jgi:DNA processing protein
VADDEKLALLTLTRVEGLGPVRVRALRRAYGSARGAVRAALERRAWPPLPRLRPDEAQALAARVDPCAAERERERLARVGGFVVTDADVGFPHAWAAFDDLPPLLYVRGRWPDALAAWPPPAAAVVGSRRASSLGSAFAFDVSHALALRGTVVVSGLALGIDAAAHRGAVSTAAGAASTIAVLASGVDRPSPAANAAIARAILDHGGALVSEMPIGHRVDTHAFPRRNRLIAALARAVLVVEAGAASGANLTAGHALTYGRDVLVCPARPWDAALAGNLALLRDGATPVCSVEDALRLLGVTREPTTEATVLPALALPAAWAWGLLDETPRSADDIVEASGRSPAATLAALERLVAVGAAAVDGSRRYRRARAPV